MGESSIRAAFASIAAASLLTDGALGAQAQEVFITVQSTTSTQASGLYEHLLPMFTEETGIEVHVVAVGTGQAIKNAQNCDGDVLLVHARPAEEAFVQAGFGLGRTDLMYNDFVVVGPRNDPAGVVGMNDVEAALQKIAEAQALFASRGDDSGTHKAERRIWDQAGVDPQSASGGWYRETGSGMGATLNTAVGMDAYALTDRATWISFENKGAHRVAVEGDEDLFNQYSVIPVSPKHCPSVKTDMVRAFADWLLSDAGQAAIASFRVDDQQLFFPNAPD